MNFSNYLCTMENISKLPTIYINNNITFNAKWYKWSAGQWSGILGKHFPTSVAKWKPNLCNNRIKCSVCKPHSWFLFHATIGMDWLMSKMNTKYKIDFSPQILNYIYDKYITAIPNSLTWFSITWFFLACTYHLPCTKPCITWFYHAVKFFYIILA